MHLLGHAAEQCILQWLLCSQLVVVTIGMCLTLQAVLQQQLTEQQAAYEELATGALAAAASTRARHQRHVSTTYTAARLAVVHERALCTAAVCQHAVHYCALQRCFYKLKLAATASRCSREVTRQRASQQLVVSSLQEASCELLLRRYRK
jgi:hypothetical protein